MKKLFAFKLAMNGLFDGMKAVFTVNTLWRPVTADPACAAVIYFSVTSDSISWYTLVKSSSKKHLPL